MCGRRVELSAEEEVAAARRILALERDLRTTLEAIPECRAMLFAGRLDEEGTRSAAVERLIAAGAVARTTPSVDPGLLARAATALDEAQALRWTLAQSAARVGQREARRVGSTRVSREDLDQEAMLGLYAAALRFEPDRGVRFGAYARWWVRAQITRAVQLSEAIPAPASVRELHRNARKIVEREAQRGAALPAFELAAELGVKPERLWDVMAASTLRAVETLDDDGVSTVLESLADEVTPSAEDHLVERDLQRWLRAAIEATFAERDREVLARRYRLGVEIASFSDVASQLGLSTERVRQLEGDSVAALREQLARELDV